MASTDKALGMLSAWSTLAVLAGVAALPFLPAHKIEHAASRAVLKPQAETRSAASAPAQVLAAAPSTPSAATAGETAPAEPVVEVWTEAEQAATLRECVRMLAPVAVEVAVEEPTRHGQCGTPAPILLRSIGSTDKVELSPAPTMNCRLAAEFARWVEKVLQPTAREELGTRITRIVGASSYSCRNVYNKPDLPLSQHATGAAIDIAGFVTADGRTIRVAKAWGPTERDIVEAQKKKVAQAAKADAKKKKDETPTGDKPTPSIEDAAKETRAKEKGSLVKTGFKADEGKRPPAVTATASVTAANTPESAFLKRLHRGACGMFGTVLGPEANGAHRNHFHLDVMERKGRGVCH